MPLEEGLEKVVAPFRTLLLTFIRQTSKAMGSCLSKTRTVEDSSLRMPEKPSHDFNGPQTSKAAGDIPGMVGKVGEGHSAGPAAKFVAGLDFGTTFSGYAYSPTGSGTEFIGVCQSWPGQDEARVLPSIKTTTSLLYEMRPNGEYKFWAWGWPARLLFVQEQARWKEKLAGRAPMEAAPSKVAPMEGQPLLLEKFKLHLSEAQSLVPPLPPGLTAMRCITDYVRELGRECFRQIQLDYPSATLDDIQWCLTVPAMWSNSAKEVMKQVAVQAGLAGPTNPHPVLIVLEPEAASIFSNHHGQGGTQSKGRYLVVDAGGGTVDLALHVTDPMTGKLKEVVSSEGELCGGWRVDDNFQKYLERQPWFMDLLQSSSSFFALDSSLLELRQQFEMAKRTFDGGNNGYVTLPRLMPPEILDRHFRNADHTKLTLRDTELRAIFDPVIDEIIKLTQSRLDAAGFCERMLLVGGFAASDYLLKRMRAHFGPFLGGPEQIVRPPVPGAAVVKGAVLYGLLPDKFGSRISKKTYGIAQTRPWQQGDPESCSMYLNGVRYCNRSFQIYVKAGQDVPVDECVTFPFEPLHETQVTMQLPLVSSPDPNVRFVTEPGVQIEDTLSVQLGNSARRTKRRVDVSLFFGKTSIEVVAVPQVPDDAVKATLTRVFEMQR